MTNVPNLTGAAGAAMTPAYVDYQRAFFGLMNFFQIDILLTESIPLVVRELEPNNPESFRRLAMIASANPEVRDPAIMQRIILELMICRLVDHFKVYLCDVVENALTISPHLLVLEERERRRIADRYQTTSEDELRTAAIIDAVDRLSDRSLNDFIEYFRDNVGIDLELDDSDVTIVNECFAVRNVIVHTRGRANLRFLRRTGRNDLRIGDLVEFTSHDCQRWSTAMDSVAQSVDIRVLESLGRDRFLQTFATFYQDFMTGLWQNKPDQNG